MKLVIMRGPSGAGKTTWAKQQYPKSVICSANDYFIEHNGEYIFKPEQLTEAHAICFEKANWYLKKQRGDKNVVVIDNTNTMLHEMSPYIMLGQLYSVDEIEIVQIFCHASVAFERNTHGVPERTVRKQAARLATTAIPPFWPKEKIVGPF